MRVGQLTGSAASEAAYRGQMASAVTLQAKTHAVQSELIARGHAMPQFGADGDWGHETADALFAEFGLAIARPFDLSIGLTECDFALAAHALGCEVAQIRAVDEVESGGGWFEDMRADILDLDGPGGFIDGPRLPKILFEAHHFSRRTSGRFDETHPNISSESWNRSLYAGGQGEWARLHRAMKLDENAALMSASVGRYQIMGFNHRLAGFDRVRAFWDAMKRSEGEHLEAFVAFIRASKLVPHLKRISPEPEDCAPFALGYNGSGYKTHAYHERIARAYAKFSRKV